MSGKIVLMLFLLALSMFICGCSSSESVGGVIDDSNLGSGMGMGMGGGSLTTTEMTFSEENTPVPGPVLMEESLMISNSQMDSAEVSKEFSKNPEIDWKNTALLSRENNIVLLNLSDGKTQSITKDGDENLRYTSPSWAIKGQQVLMIEQSKKASRICLINSDGSGFKVLYKSDERIGNASISFDSKKIVYCINETGSIWIMNRDGSNRHLLVKTGGYDPAWSPVEEKIVYTRLDSDNEYSLCTMSLQDKEDTVGNFNVKGKQPQWSPNGQRIVFSTGINVGVIDKNGSNMAYITKDEGFYENPYWLSDGTKIIFEYRKKQNESAGFRLIDLEDNTIRRIDVH